MAGADVPVCDVEKKIGSIRSKSRSSRIRCTSTEPTMPRHPMSPTCICLLVGLNVIRPAEVGQQGRGSLGSRLWALGLGGGNLSAREAAALDEHLAVAGVRVSNAFLVAAVQLTGLIPLTIECFDEFLRLTVP